MERRHVPLDALTSWILELDGRTGGPLNPTYLLNSAFVTIVLSHTPEVLLGALGSSVTDIRSTYSYMANTTVAGFGGTFNETVYYTSGLLLLAAPDPTSAYQEITFRDVDPDVFVIPRKPVHFYKQFAIHGERRNDHEARIFIRNNPASALYPANTPAPSRPCNRYQHQDYGYSLIFVQCDKYKDQPPIFGYSTSGLSIKREEKFFRLTVGTTDVKYFSKGGARKMQGTTFIHKADVALPRHAAFWREMGAGFLNAVSFHRPKVEVPRLTMTDRLALSTLVRLASINNATGYDRVPVIVKAEISEVSVSNLSRWTVGFAALAALMPFLTMVLFRFSPRRISNEIAQWMGLAVHQAEGGGMPSGARFATVPRYMTEDRHSNMVIKSTRSARVMLRTHGNHPERNLEMQFETMEEYVDDESDKDSTDDDAGMCQAGMSRVWYVICEHASSLWGCWISAPNE